MIKLMVKVMLVGLFVSSLLGCGTYVARLEEKNFASSADYYRGVATDFEVIKFDAGYASIFCYLSIVCPFVVLASVPADLAVDTLLVPFDYLRADRKESRTYAQAKMEPNSGFIKFDFSNSISFKSSERSMGYWVEYTNGTRKALRLYVGDSPLVDSSMMAYIPVFKGYLPRSIRMYGGYGSLEVKFVFLEAGATASANSLKKSDDLSVNNKVFVFYDGRVGDGAKKSEVSITPFINYPNVRFLVGKVWSPSSRTY